MKYKGIIVIVGVIILVGAFVVWVSAMKNKQSIFSGSPENAQQPNSLDNVASGSPALGSLPTSSSSTLSGTLLQWPLLRGVERITKKPFGIYITPKNSPVQPERFTGYHTGVDFETYEDEQNGDVVVFAACGGKILVSRFASGYGGVVVQSCFVNNQQVTIIYGHLRLLSVTKKVGEVIGVGDKLAVLGTGYSSETDNERKNLHFGIHIGTGINILGYVGSKDSLSGWVDPEKYLQ
jgi:hypothetical protein